MRKLLEDILEHLQESKDVENALCNNHELQYRINAILNPPAPEIKPSKVYTKLEGKLRLWEVATEDHVEAITTVKETEQIQGAVLVLL